MITANLTICATPVAVGWDAGALSGDDGGASYLQALAASLEGTEIGPGGFDGATTDLLSTADGFCALCWLASDDVPTFTRTGADDLGPDTNTYPEGALL